MKMIFESEKERDDYIGKVLAGPNGPCPSDLGFENRDDCRGIDSERFCTKCWENCGLEIRVKSPCEFECEDPYESWSEPYYVSEDECEDTKDLYDEISSLSDEAKSLQIRNDILEQRCKRLRDNMYEICYVPDTVSKFLGEGKLTPNDARYLLYTEEIDEKSESGTKKPPLGVMPKYLWDTKRKNELSQAMIRYISYEKDIPLEWIHEYNELVEKG